MTLSELKAQDDVLRQAWRDGALKDQWYANWILKAYAEYVRNTINKKKDKTKTKTKTP